MFGGVPCSAAHLGSRGGEGDGSRARNGQEAKLNYWVK